MATGGQAQPTAWWINFGSYTATTGADKMLGFTGFGTLGGGDLDVNVGGDAGVLNTLGYGFSNGAVNPIAKAWSWQWAARAGSPAMAACS